MMSVMVKRDESKQFDIAAPLFNYSFVGTRQLHVIGSIA
jgi:hypothetical protein